MTREWFGNVTTEVAFNPNISTTAKAVYLVLAVHADMDTGECYVSNATIARHLNVHRATVVRCIAELIEADALHRISRFWQGKQTSNLYTLLDLKRRRSVAPMRQGVSHPCDTNNTTRTTTTTDADSG